MTDKDAPRPDPMTVAQSLAMSPQLSPQQRFEVIEMLHELAERRRQDDFD